MNLQRLFLIVMTSALNLGMALGQAQKSDILNPVLTANDYPYPGVPDIPELPNLDPDEGIVVWEGNQLLDWEPENRLKIENESFPSLREYSQLVVYYTGDVDADYRQMLFYDGNFNNVDLYFRGNGITDNNFNNFSIGENQLFLTMPSATLSILQDRGLIIQGFGVTLTKVVLINAPEGFAPSPEVPDIPEFPNLDPNDGTVAWEGNQLLDWVPENRLKIEKESFASLNEYSQLVIYYTGDEEAFFCKIQLYDGSSQNDNLYFRGNGIVDNQFNNLPTGENQLFLTIPSSTLSLLQEKGLWILGYGVTLTKIVLINAPEGGFDLGAPDIPEIPNLDPDDGTVVWEGNEVLDWNDGFQLDISKNYFAPLSEYSQLIIYYTGDAEEDYRIIHIYDGNYYDTNVYFRGNGLVSKEFNELGIGKKQLFLTIPSSTLSVLKQRGLKAQGHGITLTKVVLVNSQEGDIDPSELKDVPDWFHNALAHYPGAGSQVFTGEQLLNWYSNFTLEASIFSGLSTNSLMVFYYELDPDYPYYSFEFSDGDYRPVSVVNGSHLGYYLFPNEQDHSFAVEIPDVSLQQLQTSGLILRGSGITLKEVVLIDAKVANSLIPGDANADHEVNVGDVLSTELYLRAARQRPIDWIINRQAADLNTLPGVDWADVKAIGDLILGK